MPNWVTTRIELRSNDYAAINDTIESIQNEDGYVDFERIIPMPENIFRGDLGEEERQKYGQNNWYDWSIANWGTKWNACQGFCEDNVVVFETAWSAAFPIFDAIAEHFFASGGEEMNVKWADEDIGSNCGERNYFPDGGSFDYEEIWPDDPNQFAMEMWGYDESDFE